MVVLYFSTCFGLELTLPSCSSAVSGTIPENSVGTARRHRAVPTPDTPGTVPTISNEDMLVISPAIGHVEGQDFQFWVLDDRIIRQRLLPYRARESKWLRAYAAQQVKMGVYRRVEPHEEDPTWIVNLILVPQG